MRFCPCLTRNYLAHPAGVPYLRVKRSLALPIILADQYAPLLPQILGHVSELSRQGRAQMDGQIADLSLLLHFLDPQALHRISVNIAIRVTDDVHDSRTPFTTPVSDVSREQLAEERFRHRCLSGMGDADPDRDVGLGNVATEATALCLSPDRS